MGAYAHGVPRFERKPDQKRKYDDGTVTLNCRIEQRGDDWVVFHVRQGRYVGPERGGPLLCDSYDDAIWMADHYLRLMEAGGTARMLADD